MSYIKLSNEFNDPEKKSIEIVERKGIGHPDTLADALAEVVSIAYSKYCLEHFGFVLHHNVDKLYIGAGLFKTGFGFCEMISPVQIRINGRMSNIFGGNIIDIKGICGPEIRSYISSVLPNLDSDQLLINSNSTQNTKVRNWFSPQSEDDLPEYKNLKANDTSVCVYHWPMTIAEKLTYELEQYFWKFVGKYPEPKFKHFGQDIKVMTHRENLKIDITICVPTMSRMIKSIEENDFFINKVENELNILAQNIVEKTPYTVKVKVNPYQRIYMLGIGSCVECGEEGIVGRGNSSSGLISIFRSHSVEAWAGKNPVYHTGRVLSLITKIVAMAIYNNFDTKCSVIAMTKNGGSLLPPYLLLIETENSINPLEANKIVEECLSVDYLKIILSSRQIK